MIGYHEFLSTKLHRMASCGKDVRSADVHPMLFPFQNDIVRWACRKGRSAIFLDTGLGKTFIQLEWARLLGVQTLIIAPLSVARQTVREARKIDLDVTFAREQTDVVGPLSITNYEMIDNFDFSKFGAVVLDESSILKSLSGSTRRKLTELCANVPYRLCCTATPAPNDYTELGNHTEFLGICDHAEMLALFFVNANKEHTYFDGNGAAYRKKGSNKGGTEWRIKHHAEPAFFAWLASWSIAMTKPSDLGYDDDGFRLPELTVEPQFVHVDYHPKDELFFTKLHGIEDAANVRRQTIEPRLAILREMIAESERDEQWIIWVGLDAEAKAIREAFPEAREVAGSDNIEHKAQTFEDFQDGAFRLLLTKPKIGGHGMNFQNAHNMAFFGMNYSWEMYYQCIRRQWRYGQVRPVSVHLIMSDLEAEVYHDVMRKDAQARRLRGKLIDQIKTYEDGELKMTTVSVTPYEQVTERGENWTAMLGDSCVRLPELADSSIDLSVYSPPFADLYTYTDSERDLGNSRDWSEFLGHYAFIIREVLRVTKPGRMTCVHTSDIPAMAQRDGYIGCKDFPGEVIRAYMREGWVFVGRAFVQKNPQAQAIRTKSKALLFVQLAKDSASSRPALIDQILLFRKPGDNAVPITPVANGEMTNDIWVEWANGIWTGIHETDTLQYAVARDSDDEKHICPLQLGTIERCIKLWSNPGETVLTPFMGIGSEAYQALRFGRKAIGIELKRSYFDVAVRNLAAASPAKDDLFAWAKENEKVTATVVG
jgi:DNA modification methylase/superfamily II DNA or RNA helicase